jgi:broad specificity phosphatase PhoE
MVIYLARHTQSEYNVLRLLNSDPKVKVHLTKKGIKQAHRLADKLKDADFDAIYISELPRTRQTAVIINAKHGAEMKTDRRLNDIASGFEGQSILKFWWSLSHSQDRQHQKFNDGESFADVHDRTAAFLDDLKKTGHSSVLIVTHSTLIQTIYEIVSGKPFTKSQKYRIPQGNFAKLEF